MRKWKFREEQSVPEKVRANIQLEFWPHHIEFHFLCFDVGHMDRHNLERQKTKTKT